MKRGAHIIWAALIGLAGCGGDDDGGGGAAHYGRAGLLGPEVTRITLEVDYQDTAAPYTDLGLRPGNPWTLTETNLRALAGPDKALDVPMELDEMTALDDLDEGPDFTVDEILDIAARHRGTPSEATARAFYVVWLDGYYEDGEGRRPDVLGVSLGDTGVIAMFKPVIDGTDAPRFVEQTTLIHELGHAIGLVNNGLSLTAAHHDAEHGAHCTDQDCVMYYLNEGSRDLAGFVRRVVLSQDTVIFGADCLADAAAARE